MWVVMLHPPQRSRVSVQRRANPGRLLILTGWGQDPAAVFQAALPHLRARRQLVRPRGDGGCLRAAVRPAAGALAMTCQAGGVVVGCKGLGIAPGGAWAIGPEWWCDARSLCAQRVHGGASGVHQPAGPAPRRAGPDRWRLGAS